VSRSRSQLASTEATLPAIQAASDRTAYRLATLTAQSPRAVNEQLAAGPQAMPSLPVTDLGALPIGTPEQLLRRRPDLVQAERQLAAATADIGVATADLFPRVSLTGLIGLAGLQLGSLGNGSSQQYALGAGLTWPVLDFGRVRSRISASEARADQALAATSKASPWRLRKPKAPSPSSPRTRSRASDSPQRPVMRKMLSASRRSGSRPVRSTSLWCSMRSARPPHPRCARASAGRAGDRARRRLPCPRRRMAAGTGGDGRCNGLGGAEPRQLGPLIRLRSILGAVTTILSIADVSKTYASGFRALEHVDLSIQAGEIFALLGPNGAGKTTLIGIVCGIVKLSEGRVTVAGRDIVGDYRAVRAMIGPRAPGAHHRRVRDGVGHRCRSAAACSASRGTPRTSRRRLGTSRSGTRRTTRS
jgi:hypothetical protein